MADQIKFTDKELQSLTELQATYNNIVTNLGQTEIQLTDSEKNLDGLKDTKLQLLRGGSIPRRYGPREPND